VQARVQSTSLLVAQCWLAVSRQDDDATDRLRMAFKALSAMNLLRFLRPLPRLAAQLCSLALEADIERDFALRAIAERQLPRPPDAGVCWPTPVRVACLGPGEVTLGDGTSAVRGKTPARPLELLWWIGAHDGQPVPVQGCLRVLWPDAEPAAARAAFDMALGRLRQLLGPAAKLRLDAGRLLPDENAIWFDTAQQRELVARITRPGVSAAEALLLARRLIGGYGGAFVGQADDLPWVLAARERQLARFSRAVRAAASLQLAAGNEEGVEDLLRAAIEAAPVDEALARRLIVLYRTRGDAAQAASAYRLLHHAREAARLPAPDPQTLALIDT
jgi:DNA-binding SARP family transcriptional activator